MWDVSHSLQVKKDLQKELPDMENITNREEQFRMTSSDIEERKIALQKLPFDELAQMFGIQEEIDPEAMEDEVNELKKEELIDSIINHMMKNHHPVIEERYQFVEWLYRIRAQCKRMGLFQPDFICIIFGEMMVKQQQSMGTSVNGTHPGY